MGGGIKPVVMVAAVAGFSLVLAAAGEAQSGRVGMRVAAGRSHVSVQRRSFTNSSSQVPGLGFDYVHLAAVGGNPGVSFSRGARNQFITPIFTGNAPLYSIVEDEPFYSEPQPQPAVVVVQQPPQTIVVQTPPQPVPAAQLSAPTPAAEAAPAAPPPDLGEFIFLRRDGQVVFAVAFTTINGRLTYITREDVRRSFPISELDKDATLQMNDANGTTMVLPN
jgi:hypothetical protein